MQVLLERDCSRLENSSLNGGTVNRLLFLFLFVMKLPVMSEISLVSVSNIPPDHCCFMSNSFVCGVKIRKEKHFPSLDKADYQFCCKSIK